MAFLLNTIYFSSPGTTKHNANNVLYLSGDTSSPHGVHESLVVEYSLMRVLLYGCYQNNIIFTSVFSAFTSWLTGAFDLSTLSKKAHVPGSFQSICKYFSFQFLQIEYLISSIQSFVFCSD